MLSALPPQTFAALAEELGHKSMLSPLKPAAGVAEIFIACKSRSTIVIPPDPIQSNPTQYQPHGTRLPVSNVIDTGKFFSLATMECDSQNGWYATT